MHEEVKKRICDYFDPDNLINWLEVTTEEVVEAFEDKISDCLDELEDYMRHGR